MLLAEYDYDTDIAVQRKEAFDDGAQQAKLETAKVLKSAGVEINLIINSTGLSPEEIEKL
jgi:predicted transposase/invertase (TIGR01784 family)